MKTNKNHVWFKVGISFFAGLFIFALIANAGTITIPSSISNALQVIQRLLVTNDGTESGSPVLDINTGGVIVAYGPLVDALANPYLTGESDPVWNAQKSSYYTKSEVDSGFLVNENDPFWTMDKPKYYTTGQIHALGYITGYTETDSIFLGSDAAGITSTEINNWNTTFGRGNHATMGYLTGEVDPVWNADKSSYYDKTAVDGMLAGLAGGLTYLGSRDYSTGNLPSDIDTGHFYIITSSGDFNGLLLNEGDQIIANKTQAGPSTTGDRDIVRIRQSETDPVFSAHAAANVTNLKISNWDTAYSRGNHATRGYITGETDPVWSGDKPNYYTKAAIDAKGYLTTYTETDPVFSAHAAANVTNTKISNWDTAYSRGNHATRGYITGETDPVFSAHAAANVTNTKISNWDTAYSRGNHATRGYITGYTETDPVFSAHAAANVTNAKITNWDAAYSRGNHASVGYLTASALNGYLTGYTETDPKIGSLTQDKGCYATGGKVVCDQDFTYSESDPVFMANSGNYYLASNPSGYITSSNVPWIIQDSAIVNTNTGNTVISGYLNVGTNANTTYPFYVRAENTGDVYANYITIDGPDTVEKGYQIGGGATSEDYKWAMYIATGEDGDKLYFANGNSKRDILTMSAAGRVGVNNPTLLGSTTPLDGFSIYPQYLDYVARYDGANYYDNTVEAYSSAGSPFTMLSGAGDVLLVGKEYPRRSVFINIATPAGTPGNLVVKYSKAGGIWGDVVGLNDATNRLRRDGDIGWTLDGFKSTWEKRIIDGQDLYWIQISLDSLAGNLPTADLITNLGVNRFSLFAGASDVNPMFTVDSNGRVGILPPELTGKYQMGTLPGITNGQLEIVSNDPSRSDVISYIADDGEASGASFISARSRGTVDGKLPVVNGDVLGGLFGYGYDGATFREGAGISFGVDGTPDILDMPGKISFKTSLDGTAAPVERMTIRNNGYVGIGTTTPSQMLTVSGNINVTTGYTIYNGAGNPYITASSLNGYLTGETDPVWLADKSNYYTTTQVDAKLSATAGMSYQGSWNYSTGNLPASPLTGYFYVASNMGDFNGLILHTGDMFIANKSVVGATTSGDWDLIDIAQTETDPIYLASVAATIMSADINNWDAAYGWGDHATVGYLTGESDPVFAASTAYGITPTNISNWNSAYTWGNHATMGYLTSYTETDPVFSAHAAANVTNLKISHWDSAYNRVTLTGASIVGFNNFTCTSGQIVKYNGSSRVCATDEGSVSSGDGYLTNLSFGTGNGTLTATVTGHANVTVNLDGRYAMSGSLANYTLKMPGRIVVAPNAQFTGLKQALEWITANATQAYEILVDAGNYTITDTMVVDSPYPVVIRGAGVEATQLNAGLGLAGKPMMQVKTQVEFINIEFDATTLPGYGATIGEDGIVFINGAGYFDQFHNVGVYGFNKGVSLNVNSEVWFFDSIVEDCIGHGVYISGGNFRLSEVNLTNNKSSVTLFAGSGNFFGVQNAVFTIYSGQIGIQYYPSTYTNYTEVSAVSNNFIKMVATGATILSGFDFTTQRDSNIEMFQNTSLEDYRPHAKINLYNGTTSQSYTSNTWSRVNYTISDLYTKKWGITTTGRLTFYSDHEKSVQMWISASAYTTSQIATVRFAVVKNGDTAVQYGMMELTLDANNRAFTFSQNVYLDEVVKNDYFEIYIYPVGSNETIVLQNLNWYIDSR